MFGIGNFKDRNSSSGDEFFDAISSDGKWKSRSSENCSINNFATLMDSFEDSQDEKKIIETRKIQFERFKKREEALDNKDASILNPTSDKLRNLEYIRSISNKKCRDDLYELRNQNKTDPEMNEHTQTLYRDGQGPPIPITQKYFTSTASANNNTNKCDMIFPDANINETQNSNPELDSLDELSSSFDECSFFKSGSQDCADFSAANTDMDRNREGSNYPTLERNITPSNNTTSGTGRDKPDSKSLFEFINPVDKQIAAIFQMSSNSSIEVEEASTSDLEDTNSLCTNSLANEIEEEQNERLNNLDNDSEQEDDMESVFEDGNSGLDTSEVGGGSSESRARSSKRLSVGTSVSGDLNNSGLNSGGGHRERSSFRSKTKEGLKSVFNKFGKVVRNVQNRAEEVLHKDLSDPDSDDANINEATKTIKYKAARGNKGSHDFAKVKIVQILHSYQTAATNQSPTSPTSSSQATNRPLVSNQQCIIWAMKFSPCGKLLASVGKDQVIRIWVLRGYYEIFKDLIKKHNASNNESQDTYKGMQKRDTSTNLGETEHTPFYSKPFITFSGHTSDILDVSWSKNLFLVTASSDKTCRLWHIYKSQCLCTFYHSSIVSAISFHPKDDRYFISACLDGKLRLWSIADKKVVLWNELSQKTTQARSNFITAVSFCQSGKTIAVGCFDGKCILYHTEHLKYYSLINARSTKGRNSRGSKITGIEVLNNDENKILITSNDSRICLYDLRDLSLVCKYKGFSNSTGHIKASLSPDDQYIISGSKDKCSYIWRTDNNYSMLNSGRRDRNIYWERIQAHNAIVTCALFSPKPLQALNKKNSNKDKGKNGHHKFQMFVSAAGCDGAIKVFTNNH